MTSIKDRVFELMVEHGNYRPIQIADALQDVSPESVGQALQELVAEGKVLHTGGPVFGRLYKRVSSNYQMTEGYSFGAGGSTVPPTSGCGGKVEVALKDCFGVVPMPPQPTCFLCGQPAPRHEIRDAADQGPYCEKCWRESPAYEPGARTKPSEVGILLPARVTFESVGMGGLPSGLELMRVMPEPRPVWHSSEGSGPPDVGVEFRVDKDRMVWCGEISDFLFAAEVPEDCVGGEGGCFIVLFDRTDIRVLAKAIDQESGNTAARLIAIALMMGAKP